MQVLWRAPIILETSLGRLSQKVPTKPGSPATFQWQKGSDAMAGSSLGLKLAQYVDNSRISFGQGTMFASPSDKGSVSKLPLRNAFVVQPSGAAALCCPVVEQWMASVSSSA